MKKVIHNDQTCVFTESDHCYKVDGHRLKSVTTLKSEFFPKFETQKIAGDYAKRNGMPVSLVLSLWKKKGQVGLQKGNLLHRYAEQLMNEEEPVRIPQEYDGFRRSVDTAVRYIKKNHIFVASEQIVFSTELGLAGQIDLLLKTNNIVLIIDWKTDKQIMTQNDWDRYAYPPIEHLDDCNFNQYAIQLNLYEYLLREEEYFPSDTIYFKRVVHITEKQPVWYRIPTLKIETKQIIGFQND